MRPAPVHSVLPKARPSASALSVRPKAQASASASALSVRPKAQPVRGGRFQPPLS